MIPQSDLNACIIIEEHINHVGTQTRKHTKRQCLVGARAWQPVQQGCVLNTKIFGASGEIAWGLAKHVQTTGYGECFLGGVVSFYNISIAVEKDVKWQIDR